MRLALFGPPGSGKGTQAAILEEKYAVRHLSTGNMLRAAITNGTQVGLDAKSFMDAGQLVPDLVVWKIAREAVEECGFDDFALDGFPRTIRQAKWLDEDLEKRGGGLKVISLEVSDDVIIERLSQRRIHRDSGEVFHLLLNPPPADISPDDLIQRKDDLPEAIAERLRVYDAQTAPIKEHYAGEGSLFEVDGVGDVQTVADRIAGCLYSNDPS